MRCGGNWGCQQTTASVVNNHSETMKTAFVLATVVSSALGAPAHPHAAAYAPAPYAPAHHAPAPAYHHPEPYHEEKAPPKPFAYEYGGADDYGRHYAKTETQDEYGVVQGEYRVELPDGRTQIVTYHADHENGFVADVKYEGEAHPEEPYHAPHPKHHAPAPYHPAPKPHAPAPYHPAPYHPAPYHA